MKRWATMAMVAAALGVMAQEAGADRERTEASRPHRQTQTQTQIRHHHHHLTRPATGIVVVPGLVPRFLYYAPVPYYVAPPATLWPPTTIWPPATAAAPSFAPDTSQYWYFCPDSRRYFPEVRECASAWLAVVPGVAGPPN